MKNEKKNAAKQTVVIMHRIRNNVARAESFHRLHIIIIIIMR